MKRFGRTLAGAIDLGSTRIKAAILDAEGRLTELRSLAAPPLRGAGPLREGDATEYLDVALDLLGGLAAVLPAGTPLGVASQRSTFLLWDRDSGDPLTPLISWQDRRAADWCARHVGWQDEIKRATGLELSAHYVGPKLAALIETEGVWGDRLASGQVLFGTLESYLLWRCSAERAHDTDLTMAARTLMVDLGLGDWSDDLLTRYAVPRSGLPTVHSTTGRKRCLSNGLVLTASVADQAAGALTLLDPSSGDVVVNLGTGAFVLRPAPHAAERIGGYLTAPISAPGGGSTSYAVEGSINGAGAVVDRFGEGPTVWPERDPSPDAFCLPDAAGLGAPYWRPEIGLTLSRAARALAKPDGRRIALEGLLFRIIQVVDGLSADHRPPRVILAGGLSREPAVSTGLAALLGRAVHLFEAHEAVLLGAARLAAGVPPYVSSQTIEVSTPAGGLYLRDKYERWLDWLARVLHRASS